MPSCIAFAIHSCKLVVHQAAWFTSTKQHQTQKILTSCCLMIPLCSSLVHVQWGASQCMWHGLETSQAKDQGNRFAACTVSFEGSESRNTLLLLSSPSRHMKKDAAMLRLRLFFCQRRPMFFRCDNSMSNWELPAGLGHCTEALAGSVGLAICNTRNQHNSTHTFFFSPVVLDCSLCIFFLDRPLEGCLTGL